MPSPFLLSQLRPVSFLRYTRCQCGAISLYRANGDVLTMLAKNKKKYLPFADLRHIPRSPYEFTQDCPRCRGEAVLDNQPPEKGTTS